MIVVAILKLDVHVKMISPTFSEKIPPSFDAQRNDYAKWKKNFEIWQGVTEVGKAKQGGLVVLLLDVSTQDAVLESLTVEEIKEEGGIDKIITQLDKMFLKDPSFIAYEVYEDFVRYKRPSNMPMAQFLCEFQKRLSKLKATKTTISEDILAYKLLKSARLTGTEEQIVLLTIDQMIYDKMVTLLKKAFSRGSWPITVTTLLHQE